MYPASTVAERTALLHATALEAMRLYGTDITQRMYLVESSIRRPNKVSFCVAVPPESEGDHVVTLPATPALSLYHHGAYEGLPAAEKKLRAYARQHGFTPKGKLRRIYLEGPPQHKDPREVRHAGRPAARGGIAGPFACVRQYLQASEFASVLPIRKARIFRCGLFHFCFQNRPSFTRKVISGFLMLTLVSLSTDSVRKALPPMTTLSPTSVAPPSSVAPA